MRDQQGSRRSRGDEAVPDFWRIGGVFKEKPLIRKEGRVEPKENRQVGGFLG
jgi:hypothetical protein